jgi:amino acid transporter
VTTILIAMVAMSLTAFSYGRMAYHYPHSGSAYVYVGQGLNAHFGFFAGWLMLLGYLVIPVVNVIYVSLTVQRVIPGVPFPFLALLIATTFTILNLRGIKFAARANEILLGAMFIVIGLFFFFAVKFLFASTGWEGVFSAEPFYNPDTFNLSAIGTATSLAALTYIGFDGVTTLAEETKNPRRNVPAAVVLTCVLTGILSAAELYLGQRVWPDYDTFTNLETAFLDVSERIGGSLMLNGMAAVLIVACFGSGFSGQAGAARLLYGMGRDRVIPNKVFGSLSQKTQVPVYNILIVGALALIGALTLNYERSAALLNFGAFLAFMGVNLASIRKCFFLAEPGKRRWWDLLIPAVGFAFCFWIWISLPVLARIAGGIWLGAGIIYSAIRTKGFREKPADVDFSDV